MHSLASPKDPPQPPACRVAAPLSRWRRRGRRSREPLGERRLVDGADAGGDRAQLREQLGARAHDVFALFDGDALRELDDERVVGIELEGMAVRAAVGRLAVGRPSEKKEIDGRPEKKKVRRPSENKKSKKKTTVRKNIRKQKKRPSDGRLMIRQHHTQKKTKTKTKRNETKRSVLARRHMCPG